MRLSPEVLTAEEEDAFETAVVEEVVESPDSAWFVVGVIRVRVCNETGQRGC
jgi:hypothetical protein